jgi:ABC-type multidrug transport system fused ATPase/permease subunit
MACAVLAALAAVGLLGVAGWFLAGAALAGLGGPLAVTAFNYLLPSAGIRAAAITRTASRYGERLLGHRAALFALAEVRASLFARIAQAALAGNAPLRWGALAARFGRDVDLLEDAAIRRVARWARSPPGWPRWRSLCRWAGRPCWRSPADLAPCAWPGARWPRGACPRFSKTWPRPTPRSPPTMPKWPARRWTSRSMAWPRQ